MFCAAALNEGDLALNVSTVRLDMAEIGFQ